MYIVLTFRFVPLVYCRNTLNTWTARSLTGKTTMARILHKTRLFKAWKIVMKCLHGIDIKKEGVLELPHFCLKIKAKPNGQFIIRQ